MVTQGMSLPPPLPPLRDLTHSQIIVGKKCWQTNPNRILSNAL